MGAREKRNEESEAQEVDWLRTRVYEQDVMKVEDTEIDIHWRTG